MTNFNMSRCRQRIFTLVVLCIRHLSDYIVGLKKKKSVIAIMHSPELDQFTDIVLKIDNKRLVYIANMAI